MCPRQRANRDPGLLVLLEVGALAYGDAGPGLAALEHPPSVSDAAVTVRAGIHHRLAVEAEEKKT